MPDAPFSGNIGDPIDRLPVGDRSAESRTSSALPAEAKRLREDLVTEVKRLREELHSLRAANRPD
ncbi:hypothetical protein [Rhodospirillaceae bacterium SYSU D60014]|uniref:hypothetical protein n=1 Tax=Virgifigura deserti TaxID=2268457 RepID=UPI000E6658F4